MEKIIKFQLNDVVKIIQEYYLRIILFYFILYITLAIPLNYMKPLNTLRLERVVSVNYEKDQDWFKEIAARIGLNEKSKIVQIACGESFKAQIIDYPAYKLYKEFIIETTSENSNCMDVFNQYIESERMIYFKKHKDNLISDLNFLNVQKKQILSLFKNSQSSYFEYSSLINIQSQIDNLERTLRISEEFPKIKIISDKSININSGYRHRYLFINLICLMFVFTGIAFINFYRKIKKNH
jgi:hypothetical protein